MLFLFKKKEKKKMKLSNFIFPNILFEIEEVVKINACIKP